MKRMCQTSHNKHQWEGVALAWLSNFSTSQLFQRNHCASTVAAQTSAPVPTDGLMVTTDFSCPLHNKHYACDRQAADRHVKLENPETHAENSASKSWRQNGRQERNSQGTTGGNATWLPHLGQQQMLIMFTFAETQRDKACHYVDSVGRHSGREVSPLGHLEVKNCWRVCIAWHERTRECRHATDQAKKCLHAS